MINSVAGVAGGTGAGRAEVENMKMLVEELIAMENMKLKGEMQTMVQLETFFLQNESENHEQ